MKYQDWIATRTTEVELPSGLTITIRKFMDLLDLTAVGDIPLPLLEAMNTIQPAADPTPSEALASLKTNVSLLKAIADAAVIEPREALPMLTFQDLTLIASMALGREAAEDLKSPVEE